MALTGITALPSTPSIDSVGNVYVHTDGGYVYGLSGADGTTMWSYNSGATSPTTISASDVVIGTDGTLYVQESTTGKLLALMLDGV